MRTSVAFLAALAPLASATLKTSTSGGALIINQCSIDIPMKNVPAMGQGVENGKEVDQILAANNTGPASRYFTPWISLHVDGGWSMKLNTLDNWVNIMQFEYTWTGDLEVWYDMSFVNGIESDHPPWHFIQAGQAPKVNAYSYATDDAQGMQAPVPVAATVTLVMCPGSTGAAAAPTSTSTTTVAPPAPKTTAAPTTTPSSSSSSSHTTTLSTVSTPDTDNAGKNVQASQAPASTAAPTKASTTTTSSDVDIVTYYKTEVVVAVVTETATAHAKARRHEHRHPHGHKF